MWRWPGAVLFLVPACETADPAGTGEGPEPSSPIRSAHGEAAGQRTLTTASWVAQSNVPLAMLGQSVATGDVNGDGFDDVVAGAPSWSTGGAAAAWHGSAGGLSVNRSWLGQVGAAMGYASGGTSVASGDLDGDGFDEVAVGAPYLDDGQGEEGGVLVYKGSAAGLSRAAIGIVQLDPIVGGSRLGQSVAFVDVNGDGFQDLLAGAPRHDLGATDGGAAFLWLGGAPLSLGAPDWTVTGGQTSAYLGTSVASAGDVDGDGYEDVLVGAPDLGTGGTASLFRGSPTGLSSVADWSVEGLSVWWDLGTVVAGAGDVDGDGYDDLLVTGGGSDNEVWLFMGSPTGPGPTPVWSSTTTGYAAPRGVGDVNGDGYDDVVVNLGYGDSFLDDTVALYLGSSSGLQASPAVDAASDQPSSGYGVQSAGGDVNGDGFADLVVGAPSYQSGQFLEGAVFAYEGLALPDSDGDGVYDLQDLCPAASDPGQLDDDGDGVGNACDAPALAASLPIVRGAAVTLTATGAAPGEVLRFGWAIGPGGAGPCPAALGGLCLDLGAGATSVGSAAADASGTATLVATAPAALSVGGELTLQVVVIRGPAGADSVKSPVLAVDATGLDADGDTLSDALEATLGTSPTSVDSDADGLADPDELAPFFDPLDEDWDDDGVLDGDDVCPAGDDASDPDLDGVASACDDCPAAADPAQVDGDGDGPGDVCDAPPLLASTTLAGSGSSAGFGSSVAVVGDVNGDGWPDVLVGSPGYDGALTDQGRADLYLGSAAGLQTAAAWSVVGSQTGATLGTVAAAGDVNADGYADVIVGAPGQDAGQADEGLAFVFLGSSAGLAVAPSRTLEANQTSARFGTAVASAGDVDGDGYDDVVVGAPQALGGGAARLYRGSAAGTAAAPSWTYALPLSLAMVGGSVASAGDVDGDGFDDVLVGAPFYASEGAAFLFHGSPTGPAATPDWQVVAPDNDFAIQRYGAAVASAGDVNGDGYGDVVIGAPAWLLGRGAAFVHLGSPAGLDTGVAWQLVGDEENAIVCTPGCTLGTNIGASVASAGDVDGDGFGDMVIGAIGWEVEGAGFEDGGQARLFLGSWTGLATAPAWTTAPVNEAHTSLGASVTAGDLDQDGLSDVLVGVPGASLLDPGAVWSYRGQPR